MSERYDHPRFTTLREAHMPAVQAPAASLTDFAHFRSKNKCIVTHVLVHCKSLPSAATSWSLQVMRGATTIAAKTISSFSVVGDMSALIPITADNTLLSAGESIALEMDGTEKGKFDVVWEYQMLPIED